MIERMARQLPYEKKLKISFRDIDYHPYLIVPVGDGGEWLWWLGINFNGCWAAGFIEEYELWFCGILIFNGFISEMPGTWLLLFPPFNEGFNNGGESPSLISSNSSGSSTKDWKYSLILVLGKRKLHLQRKILFYGISSYGCNYYHFLWREGERRKVGLSSASSLLLLTKFPDQFQYDTIWEVCNVISVE